MTDAVHATGIGKKLQTAQGESVILQDVSFRVADHSSAAFFGQSRSGKTTLIHLLAGLEPSTSGSLSVYGQSLGTLSEAERATYRREVIGLVSPEVPWLPQFSLQDNVALPLLIANVPRGVAQKRVADLCARLELPKASTLSALTPLERQQWSLARGLIHQPKLLLVDGLETLEAEAEPFIEGLFERCSELVATIIFATRHVRVAAFAEQILTLKQGRIEPSRLESNQQRSARQDLS
jgi:ABC-type lipoprotein export system ATPase subunit